MTPRTSLGFSVIEFASDVLLIDLFPWQRWLLIHALELRPEGGFRFRNVVVLVARQNGKSTLSQVLALWFMYVYGFNLVLGTAQDLDTAEEVWQGAVDLVTETDDDDVPIRPELFELYARTVMVNGKKSLNLTTGARYKAKAASRRSGRGLSGDLVLLDELREHQSWAAWGAITKTTMARDEAMVWSLSNAGDSLSVVLGYLRQMAHAALGDPDGIGAATPAGDDVDEDALLDDDDDSLAIFEWSAPPGCDKWDRDAWGQANPSRGYTISDRTIASAARTDPDAIFRTEVLCQWVDALAVPPRDVTAWAALADPAGVIVGSPTALAVDVAPGRMWCSVAVCGRRADGLPQLERVETLPGTAGAVVLLAGLSERHGLPVLLDPSSEAGSLISGLEAAGVEVVEVAGREMAQACGEFDGAVTDGEVRHLGDPVVQVALAAARQKDYGDGARRWSRTSSSADITPVVAMTLALHGHLTGESEGPGIF